MSSPAEAVVRDSRGLSPFAVFGLAAVVASAWALYQMLAWASVPALGDAPWATTLGIAVALAIFFIVGLRGPPND